MNEIIYADEPMLADPGGSFSCPWGACPGCGQFEVTDRSLARIRSRTQNYTLPRALRMTDGIREMVLPAIYVVAATPVLLKRGPASPGQDVATWRIALADARQVARMQLVSGRWNVLKPDRETYFDETTNGGTPWTWEEVIGILFLALDVGGITLVGTPAGNPANVALDGDCALDAIEQLLADVGQYPTYNPLLDVWDVEKIGTVDPDDEDALDELLGPCRIAGSPDELRSAPASVDVLFPIHDEALSGARTDPDDRWYAVNVLAPAGVRTLAATERAIYYNHAYAVREEETITNAASLATIAAGRAAEFYAQFQVPWADYELAGLHALASNSLIRRVVWVSDPDGARTFVRVHNPERSPLYPQRGERDGVRGGIVEGDGVLIQRERIELAANVGAARIVSHTSGAEYSIRRVNQAGDWQGASFSAFAATGAEDYASDTEVLVFADGEGVWLFVPFGRRHLGFSGSAVVYADDDTNHEGEASFAVSASATGAPDAGTEQRLLLRLDAEAGIPVASVDFGDLIHRLNASMTLDHGSPEGITARVEIYAEWITEDFDVSDVKWSTRPATWTSSHGLSGWGALVMNVTASGSIDNTGSYSPPGAPYDQRNRIEAGSCTGTVYGVQLRVAEIRAVYGLFGTDAIDASAVNVTADVDESEIRLA